MTLLCHNVKCPKHVPVRLAPLYPASKEQVWRYAEGFQLQVPKADLRRFDPVSAVNWCDTCATAREWSATEKRPSWWSRLWARLGGSIH